MPERFNLETLRAAAERGRIQWHQHALERLLERSISRAEVNRAIMNGDVIEVYSADQPYPSCLIVNIEREPLHVVAAADPEAEICHVITAYRPDAEHFKPDYRTRRNKS